MLGFVRERWVLPRILRQRGIVLSGRVSDRYGVLRLWVARVHDYSLLRDGSDFCTYSVSYSRCDDLGAHDGLSHDCHAYGCRYYFSANHARAYNSRPQHGIAY